MNFLIRDLSDGSFAGVVLGVRKSPPTPNGFEATPVEVIKDEGDVLAVNGNASQIMLVEDDADGEFLVESDASVWRSFADYQEWKEDLDA